MTNERTICYQLNDHFSLRSDASLRKPLLATRLSNQNGPPFASLTRWLSQSLGHQTREQAAAHKHCQSTDNKSAKTTPAKNPLIGTLTLPSDCWFISKHPKNRAYITAHTSVKMRYFLIKIDVANNVLERSSNDSSDYPDRCDPTGKKRAIAL